MATNIKRLILDPRILVNEAAGVTVIPESTPLTRLNYFDGKFLRADDLRAEQLYLRRLVQIGHQASPLGVVYGFDVTLAGGGDTLQVAAGLAIAPDGTVLYLPADTSTGVQDLIDKSAQLLRMRPLAASPGLFSDCVVTGAKAPDSTPSSGDLYLITISAAEALCGAEDVFGKLCEEACVTSTDRQYIVEGIAIRALPLRLRTPLITSTSVAISVKHLRSRVASAYFADEKLVIASLISGAGLKSNVWCLGADGLSGSEVPIGVIARAGTKTVYLDAWIARREAMETTARRYWAWRMAMRPWDAFLAQVLQFQCQLNDLFATTPDGGAGDPCADRNAIIQDASATVGQLADFYEAVTTRFRLQPILAGGAAADTAPPDVPGGLANITGLFKRLATARDAILVPSDRILIDGGILELPPGGYLPVNPASALTVNQQVRRLMGKGLDLRFCVVRPDFVPHALETVQHMDRISLVQGLDDPKNMPKVDVLVPNGEIVGQTPPSGTAFQATLQMGTPRNAFLKAEVNQNLPVLSGAARVDIPQSGPVQFFLSVDSENPAPLMTLRPLLARVSTALFSRSMLASTLTARLAETIGTPAPPAAAAPHTNAAWIGITCTQNPFAPGATGEAPFEIRVIMANDATPPVVENVRINGVYRFSRALSTGTDTRITGTVSGTSSGGDIPDTEVDLSLTPASSGQPATLRITLPPGRSTVVFTADWSGSPLVVHITETVSVGERTITGGEIILQENADVLTPSNIFHTLALHGINIDAAAIKDTNFSTVAGAQLFPPPPPPTDDLVIKATLDWVLFHRRRDKQCGAVAETPSPVPPRRYRVYHHQVPLATRTESVTLIRQALVSNNSDFLVRNKVVFKEVDVVEFGGGVPTLDTLASSILTDWNNVNPAARLVYAAIASQGAAVQDGDELALGRLDTLEHALTSTLAPAKLDPQAGPDVLKQIVSPPFDSTNADGVIVLLTQPDVPSLQLTASAKTLDIRAGNRESRASDYDMAGVMSAAGAAAQTIHANFHFTVDLPLTGDVVPTLSVNNANPVKLNATRSSATEFSFNNVPIDLPGDPPARRSLAVGNLILDALAAKAGDQVFLTGSVTSTSPVTLNSPKQMIANVIAGAEPVVAEGTHQARVFLWEEGHAGARRLSPTAPLVLTFDASNKLVGNLPGEILAVTVHGIEYDAPALSPAITRRLSSLTNALKAANRLAPDLKRATKVLQTSEQHFLRDGGLRVDDVVFLAIHPGLMG